MSSAEDGFDARHDEEAFERIIPESLSDKRIVSYFSRGLLNHDQVLGSLIHSDLFYQATRLSSYHTYDTLRESTISSQYQPRSTGQASSLRERVRNIFGMGASLVKTAD